MIWVILTLQAGILWLLWDIRRVLRLRAIPPIMAKTVPAARSREGFPGAVPPARFAVVRWPDGHHFYRGCVGAEARRIYEHTHPAPGEEVEFWELGDRRGHKAG